MFIKWHAYLDFYNNCNKDGKVWAKLGVEKKKRLCDSFKMKKIKT
jgi:hypothetical protein